MLLCHKKKNHASFTVLTCQSTNCSRWVEFSLHGTLAFVLLLHFLFFFFFFRLLGINGKETSVFCTELTCTRPMTVLLRPHHSSSPSLAAAHAAGWRSRRRQQIRRTQERAEKGRRESSVLPDRRAQCLILSFVLPALIAST